jgi:hypothetical protein
MAIFSASPAYFWSTSSRTWKTSAGRPSWRWMLASRSRAAKAVLPIRASSSLFSVLVAASSSSVRAFWSQVTAFAW